MENIISVIVTTYNQEQTIGRTLDGILRQQCHLPIEVVVGEDCSTDGTRQVCQDYARRYPSQIRLLLQERNRGIIDNYFDCIEQSRGRYLADCAGDDFWTDPLKLEKQLRVMEAHPDVTLVHTAWLYYHEDTGRTSPPPTLPFTRHVTPGREMLQAIVTQVGVPVVHLCTALYRADVFRREYEADRDLFRRQEWGCEDLQIVFIMARCGQIAYLPDPTVCYSCGHESVSLSADERKQFRFVRGITALSHHLATRYGIRGTAVSRYFGYRIYALSMHAFRAFAPELIPEILRCESQWHAPRWPRTRLILFIMRHRWLWQSALSLRRAVVRMKKVH